MNRFAVMVDAGYLLRQAIEIVSDRRSKQRGDLEIVQPAELATLLIHKSKELLALDGKELLRIYWYDGVMATGLTAQQRQMMDVDDVLMRAGTINGAGQQKGVDSLIVTDLIELTSHHAICDAVLLTGDSDLAVGIEIAQRRGVRIAVLGIEDLSQGVPHHQSFEITSRADRVGRLGRADIAGMVKYAPRPKKVAATPAAPTSQATPRPAVAAPMANPTAQTPTGQTASPAAAQVAAPAAPKPAPVREMTPALEQEVASAVAGYIDQAKDPAQLRSAIDPTTSRIRSDVDKLLIHAVFEKLARGQLTNGEKVLARAKFRALLAERQQAAAQAPAPKPADTSKA